ncbi:protein phosphatase 1 regulatory subunit 32-like [Patiria miniata]|uniref:Protein phosphatase 1 regulatory subunit 32 n=1 Tax=Patiria miniata TaxID=46514 RepID=A0A914BCG1_PATMI|nr:protein phosphatase 1 regulatory subunit 32-like [Patiria miniata]
MGRLPHGQKTAHVDASNGPDADIMKFFSTSYSSSYGKDGYSPRTGKHVGTGYQSNFRPGVYYSQRIDVLDNPAMEKLLRKNYTSITKMHFNPAQDSNGRDPLPSNLTQVGSGFTRQDPITTPTVNNVQHVCVDTRYHGIGPTISGVLPRHRPLLHKLRSKDPVSAEHAAHGPGFMSTESKVRYQGRPSERLDVSTKTVGRKEGSGYTHAYNVEPIQFHPGSSFSNELPGFYTDRPTGVSVMKTAFLPSQYSKGDEKLPVVANRSDRETGFTHEKAKPLYVNRVMRDAYTTNEQVPGAVENRTKKADPAEYLNMTNPDNHSSITSKSFLGKQRPDPSEHERLGRYYVGNKELSGYSDNNDKPQVQIPIEPMRWITHYDTKFYNMNPKGKARAGRTFGNVMDQLPDGFTKSTAVHSFGPELDSTAQLRQLHPYVARSIKARDTYYDDHTHDTKRHISFNTNIPQVLASV